MTISTQALSLRALRTVFSDDLYRGTFYLLANTVATSAIGFVFWTLAAHRYPESTVGTFSGVISGANLLAAVAALGLPITMTRHIASVQNPRELVIFAITVIATVGTILCLATMLLLGPRLPAALHVGQRGGMAFLLTALVIFTAAGSTLDAGLVATRSSPILLIKNLAGSIAKLVAMLALATFRSSGLLISFGLGLALATILSGVALGRRIKGKGARPGRLGVPWHYLSDTSANYLATVIGILPITIVPIEVLAVRGTTQTAHFSVALIIAGILNFIPSTMGQVLFAEVARGGVPLGIQFRKALRAVYGLLVPSLALLIIFAPFILRLFGRSYEMAATDCLRILALSALAAGGTYLVDSLLIARDRTSAYIFMQVVNAALMLGCVGLLLPRGITGAACGWALAQGVTLIIGLIVLATGRLGRHHPKAGTAPAGQASRHPGGVPQPQPAVQAFEPQIQELLAMWPTMPTTLIAEWIGWDHSPEILSDRVTEMRSAYLQPTQNASQIGYPAGQTAQCSLWFPPTEIPVGRGQVRSASQLPVLTMITGYSRWLSAILIPSSHAEDLFAGWWQLIAGLGGVPRTLTSHSGDAIGWWMDGQAKITAECTRFCRSLGTTMIIGRSCDPTTTGLIEEAQAYLECSFLYGRSFNSPEDFSIQLRDWLSIDNTRHRQPPSYSPATLIAADRTAMLPLPPIPPATGWLLRLPVGDRPFVRFDSNEYSVPPALIGCMVDLVADLSQIRVLHEGKVMAVHDRLWARGQTIRDPAHGTAYR